MELSQIGNLFAMVDLAPFHLLSYSTLLGMSIYQSFTVVRVVHRTLPRPAFITLQGRLFPIYFQQQTLYLFLTAATFPPFGPVSLFRDGISAVLFSVAGTGILLNLLVYGPRTRQAMIDRSQKSENNVLPDEDIGEADEEVPQALNEAFHHNHAMSLHLNLITIVAMVVLGWRLALRIKTE